MEEDEHGRPILRVICFAAVRADGLVEYGLGGLYEIAKEEGKDAPKPGSLICPQLSLIADSAPVARCIGDGICGDCIDQCPLRPHLGVTCELCRKKYPSQSMMEGGACVLRAGCSCRSAEWWWWWSLQAGTVPALRRREASLVRALSPPFN